MWHSLYNKEVKHKSGSSGQRFDSLMNIPYWVKYFGRWGHLFNFLWQGFPYRILLSPNVWEGCVNGDAFYPTSKSWISTEGPNFVKYLDESFLDQVFRLLGIRHHSDNAIVHGGYILLINSLLSVSFTLCTSFNQLGFICDISVWQGSAWFQLKGREICTRVGKVGILFLTTFSVFSKSYAMWPIVRPGNTIHQAFERIISERFRLQMLNWDVFKKNKSVEY